MTPIWRPSSLPPDSFVLVKPIRQSWDWSPPPNLQPTGHREILGISITQLEDQAAAQLLQSPQVLRQSATPMMAAAPFACLPASAVSSASNHLGVACR